MRFKAPLALLLIFVPLAARAAAPSESQMTVLRPIFAALHAVHGGRTAHRHGHAQSGGLGARPNGVEAIHVDTTHTFTPTDGSAARSEHVVGDLSIRPNADGTGHTLGGTVTTTDEHGAFTVTLTDVSRGHKEQCMLPSSGSASVKAADGTSHAVVFTSTCGEITLDGAPVTLPAHTHEQ